MRALAFLVTVVAALAPSGWAADPANVHNLGIAVKAVTFANSEAAVGPSPEGGQPVFYMSYYQSTGAELLAYDIRLKKVYRWNLLGGQGGYGLCAGSDGKVYVGMAARGRLVQFDPKTQVMRDLGSASQPTTYLWGCAAGADGKVFAAGYPQCIPLVYDAKSDALTSPGTIAPRPGAEYLRAVCCDAKGRAWFGVGTRAALVVYDPADGSHRNVLPERFAPQSTVVHLVRGGNLIYASILYSGKVLVFDADTCTLLREVAPPADEEALMPVAADSQGNVYCGSLPDGHLYRIAPGAAEPHRVASFLGDSKAVLDDRYLLAVFDNQQRIFDLRTGQIVDQRQWIEPRGGMAITATLTLGPGGKIYGATFINQHFFCCDPETRKIQDLGRILLAAGQCDSMCRSRDGKRIWMGCYVGAHIAVYDPSRPYKLGSGPDCNPRDFGRVGGGQYRTLSIVEGPQGKVYCGTVPAYNSAPTGGLAVLDPATGQRKVLVDLVPGGTVSHLEADHHAVYGFGGGVLFALDPQTLRKVKERKMACTAMLLLPDGTLAISTPADLQGLDPFTLATQWTIPFAQVKDHAGFHRLLAAPDGKLYGASDQGIFRIDLPSKRLIPLTHSPCQTLAADEAGRLYYAQAAQLFMIGADP